MDKIRRLYATVLEKGFNVGKEKENEIHVQFDKPKFISSHKINKIKLLSELDYHFIMNEYLSKEEYETILKSLL